MLRLLVAAAACFWAAAASAQPATPHVVAGAPVNLIGSGTSAYDALISVTGGGSVSGQGSLTIQGGQTAINGVDGTVQVVVPSMQSSSDYVMLQGGQSGFGPTIGCLSAADTNVNCQVYAQGAGAINIGNGSGLGLQVADPGAAVTYPLIAYGGTASTYPEISSSGNMQVNVATTDGVFVSEAGVNVLEVGGGTTPPAGACYPIIGVNDTAVLAKISANASACGLYFNVTGTSSITFANAEGSILQITNSSANTVADVMTMRAASSTVPDIIYGTSANVYIGNATASALSLSATLGYPMIPGAAGKATGTPLNASAAHPAFYWNSTASEMCVYDTSWHCSTAFTN